MDVAGRDELSAAVVADRVEITVAIVGIATLPPWTIGEAAVTCGGGDEEDIAPEAMAAAFASKSSKVGESRSCGSVVVITGVTSAVMVVTVAGDIGMLSVGGARGGPTGEFKT
jgi:hypothetical protein